jgi:hypothetical protein
MKIEPIFNPSNTGYKDRILSPVSIAIHENRSVFVILADAAPK